MLNQIPLKKVLANCKLSLHNIVLQNRAPQVSTSPLAHAGIRLKIEQAGGISMTQVQKVEPDVLSGNDFGGNEPWQIPAIGTPERAALLDAIKQNFPEIYSDPHDSGKGKQFREPHPDVSPNHPPPWA